MWMWTGRSLWMFSGLQWMWWTNPDGIFTRDANAMYAPCSGSAVESTTSYLFGYLRASIKLVSGYSAGVAQTFYVSVSLAACIFLVVDMINALKGLFWEWSHGGVLLSSEFVCTSAAVFVRPPPWWSGLWVSGECDQPTMDFTNQHFCKRNRRPRATHILVVRSYCWLSHLRGDLELQDNLVSSDHCFRFLWILCFC